MDEALTWQQTRRAKTRERLLSAAAEIFVGKGYGAATVEDILLTAEVGRTTFYKHFSDKLTVAAALFERFMPPLATRYGRIADVETPNLEAVTEWIDDLIDAYAAEAGIMTLFRQIAALEPGFAATVAKVQDDLMARLGRRFTVFARAIRDDQARTTATIVVNMIDQTCVLLSIDHAPLDRGIARDFIAAQFVEFTSQAGKT